MPIDLDPHLSRAAQGAAQALPGVAGSFLAMWRVRTLSWRQRALAFLSGCAVSFWGAPVVLAVYPRTEPYWALVALLMGWFGKTVVDKLFETLEQFAFGALLSAWLRKVLGLPEAPAGKAVDDTKEG
jgi:uncharacterized membrane protein YeaQ/YmgE (transglycosylase-associated protein family)